MYETLNVSTADGIASVRFNRPRRLNAINSRMIGELAELCRAFDAERSLRAVVFSGEGRVFCAGADITELDGLDGPSAALEFLGSLQAVTNAIESLKVPTIAALNGSAFGGGCEIALACDLRLMAADASIGVPEIKIGLLPGAGGSQRLPRLLPAAIAKQMIYFGEPLDAERAAAYGLVNAVVPGADLMAEAERWAARLAALPPLALAAGKRLVHGSALHGLHNGIEAERQTVAFLFSTADKTEGLRAFLEKRSPTFSGH